MKTIHAIYENGIFRPTEPVSLPEKCEVRIELTVKADSKEAPLAREMAGTGASDEVKLSIEDKLAALAAQVPQEQWNRLPTDLTDNLDHYIYGTTKQ